MSMKAIVVTEPGNYSAESIAIPTPGKNDVLVRVHGCTICGSDVKMIDGDMSGIAFPLVPGHEWSGTVVDAGSKYKDMIDQRIVSDILQNCGKCRFCHSGRHNLCVDLIEPGLTAQGAFAEYITVPGSSVLPISARLKLDDACLVEPLSVVLYALSLQSPQPGNKILIIGGGGIGLLLLSVLYQRGHESIALIDPHQARRDMALTIGATVAVAQWQGQREEIEDKLGAQANLIYNTASRASGFLDAIDACQCGGRICQIGYTGAKTIELSPSEMLVKLLDIKFSLSPTASWSESLAFLEKYAGALSPLITHRLKLENFESGLAMARKRDDGAIRIMINP